MVNPPKTNEELLKELEDLKLESAYLKTRYEQDITEQKHIVETLHEDEKKFRAAFENAPMGMSMTLPNGQYIAVNSVFCKMLGYSEEELLARTFNSVTHPDDIERGNQWVQKMISGDRSEPEFEKCYIHKDGHIVWGLVRAEWIKDDAGFIKLSVVHIMDITERKRAEEMLKQAHSDLENLHNNLIDAIFSFDTVQNKMITASPAHEKVFGYPPSEFFKNPQLWYELIVTEDRPIVDAGYPILFAGKNCQHEVRITYPDGKIRWIQAKMVPTLDVNGKLVRIDGIVSDITERKQVEEKLRESEQKLKTLFETSIEGICVVDANDKINLINPHMEKMLGYNSGELLNMSYTKLLTEDELNDYLTKQQERRKGQSEVYEQELLTKEGSTIWVMISASPIFDKEGTFQGSFGMFTNITELKAAESEIRKFYLGVEQSPAAVIITDIKGNIEYVNPRFCELTNYSYNDVIGNNPRILKSGNKTKEEYKVLWDTILSGKSWHGELLNKKKNGEVYHESASISPIKNETGEITHFIAIKLDVTEKKKILDELIIAKDMAEESNRLKSNFLANMSHELRTPLIGILGYSEAIREEANDETIAKMAEIIHKGGIRLLETLNLILNLSRIEAGRLELNKEVVDVELVLNEVIELFTEVATGKNLYIKKMFTASKTKTKTDRNILSNIFNNLVNNGIKYTKEGGITISVENKVKDGGEWIAVSFRDTGIGISKENQKLIWEEFRQVSEGYSRVFEGNGLGLTVTKKFAEKLQGKISVQSEVGIGSVFTIEIPIEQETCA
jgi:PAS domain S-box-containing protein